MAATDTTSQLVEASSSAAILDQEHAKKRVLNRLKRAYGQLGAVITAVEGNADCRAVITQLAAVSSAIERAGFAIVATGMKHCLSPDADKTDGAEAGVSPHDGLTIKDLEKLFMMLS